jgi:hypothetical protein
LGLVVHADGAHDALRGGEDDLHHIIPLDAIRLLIYGELAIKTFAVLLQGHVLELAFHVHALSFGSFHVADAGLVDETSHLPNVWLLLLVHLEIDEVLHLGLIHPLLVLSGN